MVTVTTNAVISTAMEKMPKSGKKNSQMSGSEQALEVAHY
jgi:hypothetical protein